MSNDKTARKPALTFIFITLVLDILGIGLCIPILPRLIVDLNGGEVENSATIYGSLAALYAGMQLLFAPLLGNLSDRFGRRPVILTALIGSGIDYLLLGYAPTLLLFFIGRAISGITGASYSAATAYIADVSPPEKRAANFGLVGAAFGLGFIIGPALGGYLGEINIRLPFFVAAGLTLLNWLYGLLVLPESLAPENRRNISLKKCNPLGAFAILRKYKQATPLAASLFLYNLAHQVYPSLWVLYTGYRYGWSPKQIGLSLATVGLLAALVQGGLTRRIVPKLGETKTAMLGLAVTTIALICYGFANEGWIVYCIMLFGCFGGLCNPAIQGLISRMVGDDEQGGTQGALSGLNSLAGLVAPPIITACFAYFISAKAPLTLPGAPFFMAAFVSLAALVLLQRTAAKQ